MSSDEGFDAGLGAKRRRARLVGYLAVLLVAMGFHHTPLAQRISFAVHDTEARWLARHVPKPAPQPEVVVIGIDAVTLERLREPLALWHEHLGAFLRAMAAAEPRLLVLDVVLADRSYDFVRSGIDQALLSGLLAHKGHERLVLAQTIDDGGRLRPLFAPIVALAGEEAIGLAIVEPDADGIVRRLSSAFETDRGRFPTMLGRVLDRLGQGPLAGRIDFSVGEPFAYVPFHDVVSAYARGDEEVLRERFAGRHVFLGAVLPFSDRHEVPVAIAGWEPGNLRVPGVLVQAQSLRTVLANGPAQPLAAILVLVLIAFATLLYWASVGPRWDLGALAATLVVLLAASTLLLARGLVLPIAGIGVAALIGCAARRALEGSFAMADRRRLRGAFGGYVSPNVMSDILSGRIRPGTGGERRRVCVLFSDVRGYTTRSEHESPEAIIGLLNEYFEEMTTAVHGHHGTIDKFIGDGLMAFFGAPNERANPAEDAFAAAREMLGRLSGFNARLAASGVAPIEVGIGLHVGEVVVGHVGSSERHEYTIIGDTVNTTARLEGLTKGLDYPVVVSEDVARDLSARAALVDLGLQSVKGRAPVSVCGWRPGAGKDETPSKVAPRKVGTHGVSAP